MQALAINGIVKVLGLWDVPLLVVDLITKPRGIDNGE